MSSLKYAFKILIRLFSKTISNHISQILHEVGKSEDAQFTYSRRERALAKGGVSRHYRSIGILIQGKLSENEESLVNLAQSYFFLFPGIQIVVSTWKINPDLRLKLENLGVTIVSSSENLFTGTGNVNLQIHTTKTGLAKFDDRIQYVLKTRTDMQVFDNKALDFLMSTFKRYGFHEGTTRIIIPSFNTMKFRCYSASDQLQFSTRKRLEEFWGCPFMPEKMDQQQNTEGEYPGISRPMWATNGIQFAEEYLVTQDMLRLGIKPDYSLVQSLGVYRDSFVIINESNLDLVWNKNSLRDLTNRAKYQNREIALQPILDWEWLDLNENLQAFYLNAKHELESIINLTTKSQIEKP